MYKLLANDGIDAAGKALLVKAGFEVSDTKIPQEELAAHIGGYDALLVRSATKVRKDILDAGVRLKVVGRAGVGVDNIDVAYAKEKNIAVINTPAASTHSVAELVMAHIYSIARMLHDSNRFMPTQGDTHFNDLKKKYSAGFELEGKTIGIIGIGNIGKAVAKLALGAGMNVLACDIDIRTVEIPITIGSTHLNIPLTTVTKEELVKNSDIISVHIAGSTNLLNAEEFALMKKGVVIINCARGGVIDEALLLAQLNSGHVKAAGLDVFVNEPTPIKALLEHPHVSLSPHIAGSTVESQYRIGVEVAEKIIAHFNNI